MTKMLLNTMKIPTHEMNGKCSPNTITPSIAAVIGSAKLNVTAAADDTFLRPSKKVHMPA